MGDTKFCRRCRAEKPVDDYHRCGSAKDGLQAYCKPCMLAAARRGKQASAEQLGPRTPIGGRSRRVPAPDPRPASVRVYRDRCKADDEKTARACDQLRAATDAALGR